MNKKDLLSVKQQTIGKSSELLLEGSIDERATFPEPNIDGIESLTIDLEGIGNVNSAGVRRWIIWIWNLEKRDINLKIIFRKIPTKFAKQMAIIKDFLPKRAQINSINALFYCLECDGEVEKTIDSIHLSTFIATIGDEDLSIQINCNHCHGKMSLDESSKATLKELSSRFFKPLSQLGRRD